MGHHRHLIQSAPGRRRRVLLALGWYAAPIHQGIIRYAREAEWILDAHSSRSGMISGTWRGDGILCALGSNPQVDQVVFRRRVPTVNIGPGCKELPHVIPDNERIGQLAADYFRRRGFKHFAYYIEPGSPSPERLEAFRRHCHAQDASFHLLDRQSVRAEAARRRTDLHDWLARRLAELPKPLAVLAEFDDLAIDLLDACAIAGIRVPEQVAVLGVDNDPLRCEFAPVTLSSIDHDLERHGYEAAALLERLMNGKPAPRKPVVIPPKGIVTRRSTDILVVEHPLVAATLRLIRDHYTEPITAQILARRIPLCYRRLHDAFVKHIGRSIADEITRLRIEHAQRLLAQTALKNDEVARLAGFTDDTRMAKVFSRQVGESPRQYRLNVSLRNRKR